MFKILAVFCLLSVSSTVFAQQSPRGSGCMVGGKKMPVANSALVQKVLAKEYQQGLRVHVVGTIRQIESDANSASYTVEIRDGKKQLTVFSETASYDVISKLASGKRIELCGYVDILQVEQDDVSVPGDGVKAIINYTYANPGYGSIAVRGLEDGFSKIDGKVFDLRN